MADWFSHFMKWLKCFSHFMKWLISQIGCNIYTVRSIYRPGRQEINLFYFLFTLSQTIISFNDAEEEALEKKKEKKKKKKKKKRGGGKGKMLVTSIFSFFPQCFLPQQRRIFSIFSHI